MLFRKSFCAFVVVGFIFSSAAAEVFPLNSDWQFLKGLSEASLPDTTAWRLLRFDDAAWSTAQSPFWYGDSQPAPGTHLTDMRDGYTCIFMRKLFHVSNVNDLSELQLGAQSDDGFIAWINGVEVGRFNMPDGNIPYNGASSPALWEPIPFQTTVINSPGSCLVEGDNLIAVQAFNSSLNGSSDFVINVSLSSSVDVVPPSLVTVIPPVTATVRFLTAIEVHFNEPVSGVDASDLRINGIPAADVSAFTPSQYVFMFPEPAAGLVHVEWSPTHGIADLASTPNLFPGGNWTYTLDPDAPVAGVIISEFMADNRRTINDEDGNSPDWIELHNAGQSTAWLNGWFLTDDPLKPAKWRLPTVAIAPGGYLLIFASEKNRIDPAAPLHTNFKLENSGEYLALLDPQTNVVSEFAPAYPAQLEDVSYGRDRYSPSVLGFFTEPTPGAANTSSGPGFAPAVSFSRVGGTFTSGVALELSTASASAVIRYTLNGSVPTASSTVYAGPIPITTTTQVRARSFEPGLLPGPVRSEIFVGLDASVVNFTSDLPLVIIDNFGAGGVPADSDQLAYMGIFDVVGDRSSLTNPPNLSTRAGINIRGSSTSWYPKSSFSVEWWDETDEDKDLPVLDMPAESDWVLYAPNNFEPVLIHNPFIYQLSNQIGRYAPRTRFVEVYLNRDGGPIRSSDYNGIYVLMEKIKRGKDRVDVEKLEPENLSSPEVTGGYVLKIDRADPGDSGFNAAGQTLLYVDPKEETIELPQRDPQEQYIRNYFDAFGSALNGSNYRDPVIGYRAFADVDSWIDHHILNVMAFNVDALRLSAYFYKEREGKIGFGPIWDFDRALGSTDGRDSNPRVWRSTQPDYGTDFFNYTWWGRMFADPDFWQEWVDRYQDLRLDRLSLTNMNALIDALASEVRQAQPREQSRWGVDPRGGSYQAEVNLMKNWLADRIGFMDGNFLDKPVLSSPGCDIEPGFNLTLSGPPGATIYYTLDGKDPRLPGGDVLPGAIICTGPIMLQQNSRVVARAWDSNHQNLTGANNPPISTSWSGVSAATFVVQTPPLVVTEIMYHPEQAPAGNTNSADNFEYIELKNLGSAMLDLNGFRFTNGIDFTFTAGANVTLLAPGETVLLVRNLAAFVSRYPGVSNIGGEYLGNLDNAGERIALVGPMLEPILDFRYEDSWYRITDGLGFSLVIVDENAPLSTWGSSASWRPSGVVNGSPGHDDPAPPILPRVLINEGLTHTDLPQVDTIELHNPASTPADIGGWFLTDDFNEPKKYRVPDGTSVAPNGFITMDETDFNSGAPGSFLLSSLGDELFLFSADTNMDLTGYVHGFEFGAAQNGVAFGRHVTSLGDEHFVAQAVNTLGFTNAGPRVGPVVINEIMYAPAPIAGTNNNTIDEYVELRNITTQPALLFDPNFPTNAWKLAGGIDYLFPTNLSISAGAQLLIVGFDPGTEPATLAGFRNRLDVDPGVTILGPYSGVLENSGERVKLMKPDPPQAGPSPNVNFIPYVLVDQVKYSSQSPWPNEADGSGRSLSRIMDALYGDDPANWEAVEPTPGQTNPGGTSADTDHDGLPNEWETANGLNPDDATGDHGANGDPDGDRMTNLQEFISGTHPNLASDFLQIEFIANGGAERLLQFHAVAGKTYTIEYCDELESEAWTRLTDVPAQPGTGPMDIMDPGADSVGVRFYRLVTPQQP